MKTVAIYARVSTSDQSAESQLMELRAYAQRRTTSGRSKREILRCLKRYIAREVFKIISAALAPAAT